MDRDVTDKKTCSATTKAGKPCPNHTLDGGDLCFAHAGSADDRKANARHARKRQAMQQRRAREPLLDFRLIAERDAMPMIFDGLRAEIDEPGFKGPDWSVRLISMMLLSVATGAYLEPDTVYTRLQEMIPKELRPVPMPTEDEWMRENRRAWDRTKMRWSDLTGLVIEPYPPFMIPSSMSMDQAIAEGRAYLAALYDSQGERLGDSTTHVQGFKLDTGEMIPIPRVSPNALAA